MIQLEAVREEMINKKVRFKAFPKNSERCVSVTAPAFSCTAAQGDMHTGIYMVRLAQFFIDSQCIYVSSGMMTFCIKTFRSR